jgi:uncharacterized membrane protein
MDRIAGGMWGLDRTVDRGGTAMDVSRHQGRRSDAVGTAADDRAARASTVPAGLTVPGILLGVGLGGFVDGIVLHQILQWHHLLSATAQYPPTTVAGLEVNTLADGLFHAATWLATAGGLVLLWRAVRHGAWVWGGRRLAGWMAVGWGLFNLVEGTVDHHLLRIHRVRPAAANPLAYDIGCLALGAVLVAGGWLLQRAATRRPDRTPTAGAPADR